MSIATATWMCLWVSTPTITFPRVRLDSPVIRHRMASSGAGAAAGWADRTVMGRRCSRPLLGHCPSGQTGCRVNRSTVGTSKCTATAKPS